MPQLPSVVGFLLASAIEGKDKANSRVGPGAEVLIESVLRSATRYHSGLSLVCCCQLFRARGEPNRSHKWRIGKLLRESGIILYCTRIGSQSLMLPQTNI